MSLLATLVLAATTARVEAVTLAHVDSRPAVRVLLSGEPARTAVQRAGENMTISIAGAHLGGQFAGGNRFTWTPVLPDCALLAGASCLDHIEVNSGDAGVSVLLHVPPEVSIDVRRDRSGLLLIFREVPEVAPSLAQATPRAPSATPASEPPEPLDIEPLPETVERDDVEPSEAADAEAEPLHEEVDDAPDAPPAQEPPHAPSPDTAALARSLFPDAGAETTAPSGPASVSELYPRLFPAGPPRAEPETVEPDRGQMADATGVPVGPFRVQASVDARYVDADTYIEGPDSRTRARYLEVVPRVTAETAPADGRLSLEYAPSLRAFSNIDEVNSTSHRASAGLDLSLGPNVTARAQDSFVSGVLDTREVDPGGEYFFGLARFHRNTVDGGVSVLLGPRLSLELAASTSTLRFQEESTFFDYDSRLVSGGLGYELTPTLKTTLLYSYDTVPTPLERPQAANRAHNVQLTFAGNVLPLVSGRLMVGYRDQRSPNGGAGGTRYTGLTMGGSVTKQFGYDSHVTLYLNRSTPVSAFEDNAFYVHTSLQATGRFPLPLELQLQGGLGYQWNDYRTLSLETGEPRKDDIFGYELGLRRALHRRFFLSAAYRREERRSNLERFDTDSDGFYLQLEWNFLGQTP